MKCLFFLILIVTTAYAARSSILDSDSDRSSSGDRSNSGRRSTRRWQDLDTDDQSSTGNRDSGSSRGGQALSSLGVTGRLPENVRVEVEMVRLENPDGIQYNGKKCGWIFSGCDTILTAFLDKDKPFSPVNTKDMDSWTKYWNKNKATSDDIGRSVTSDVCGGAFNNVNLRVRAVSSGIPVNSEMEYFDCPFKIRLADIAASASDAKFGRAVECKSKYQPGKIRLMVRMRAYEIPASSCSAVAV